MSVIGGQNPIVQDGLVYILDFGNERSYVSGSNSAESLIYNPVTASFAAPLAGDYSGLAAAYSVRRVVSSYSGPAMEVQSGSVSASIGFDSLGNLDTVSLESFAGSGDAFVKTWYDQSGNGRNATQTTAANQPQIVSGGSVITENGKPSIKFDGSSQYFNTSNKLIQLNTTIAIAFNFTRENVYGTPIGQWSSGTTGRTLMTTNQTIAGGGSSNYLSFFNTPATGLVDIIAPPGMNLIFWNIATGSGNYQVFNNGSNKFNATITSIATNVNTAIGVLSESTISGYFDGVLSELIFWGSIQSSRTSIESNINSYYNIFTASFDPTPGFDQGKLEFNAPDGLNTNQSFPGFSYDQGNLTLIFTGETKAASTLFSQDGTISIVSTTSSIGYGSATNNLGRTSQPRDLIIFH